MMRSFPVASRDSPQTRARRRTILAQAPLTAPLAAHHADQLLAACRLATCPAGTFLFTSGGAPRDIFLIGSGFVQIRSDAGGPADAQPSLHLRLCGAGEMVADRELACLAAGVAGNAPRRLAAVVLGDAAEIVAIEQAALARVLAEDPAARARVAAEVGALIDALHRLANELAGLKNLGKVRLARFLLELFTRMGQMRGGALQLPHPFSHADLAAALGLTRRSVFDDMLALETFDAIDHDLGGRLVLRDRDRLVRIASLEPSDDREAGAATWRADIDAALAANDTLHAFELAREAQQTHPRDTGLRYRAALSALRAGAPDKAEEFIGDFKAAPTPDERERIQALAARVMKERAFTSPDRATLRARARQSAELYHAAHLDSRGDYSALNAAAMYHVAGETEAGVALARGLVHGQAARQTGYWACATRAEAFWLLGDTESAAAMLCQARIQPDADDGKMATTRRQLQLLSACFGRDAAWLAAALPAEPVLVGTVAISVRVLSGLGRPVFLAVDSWPDMAALAALKTPPVMVLAAAPEHLAGVAPAARQQSIARPIARRVYHIADGTAGPASPARRLHAWRRALGLGLLAAEERGAAVALLTESGGLSDAWPDWAAPDALAAGQSALLWVQVTGDAHAAALSARTEALEKAVSGNAATLRFTGPAAALEAAWRLLDEARTAGTEIRLCLDVENLSATTLGAASLQRTQPQTGAGGIFASEAAAAELALLRQPAIRLIAVGRVRSQRRLNRIGVWAVKHAAAWT